MILLDATNQKSSLRHGFAELFRKNKKKIKLKQNLTKRRFSLHLNFEKRSYYVVQLFSFHSQRTIDEFHKLLLKFEAFDIFSRN